MQKNDILWKSILEDVFEDFLTFFYPDSEEIFDFEKGFIFLDNELQQLFPPEEHNYERKFIDKLVQVYTKGGKDHWVLIHIEVQGHREKHFEERMFRYYYRIFDKYKKQISAFAILTDSNSKFVPNQYNSSFLGTTIHYKFNTYKILGQSKEELISNPNPFSCVILAAMAAIEGELKGDDFTFQFKRELYNEFKKRTIPPKKKLAIALFLQNYVTFKNLQFSQKFNDEIIDAKNKTMGIEEFIKQQIKEEGKEEERMELASKLKNLGVELEKIASSTGLSIAEIKKL